MIVYDEIEYTVPSPYLCALVNGYVSGLNDSDIAEIDVFTSEVIKEHGHALFSGCKPVGMLTRNDINNMFSDCSILTLLVTKQS